MSGECEECSKKQRLGLQTKLKVNEPGDIYEQEADRIADQVTAMPVHHAVSGAPPRIQRLSGQPNGQMNAAPASVSQALASPGRPLEPALRQDMEQCFGYDFSRVRLHTDAYAAESAKMVNALAYTLGRDVVFAAGQYNPVTTTSNRLLAHELVHVIQQDHSTTPMMLTTGPAVSVVEHQPDRATIAVGAGRIAADVSPSFTNGFVQRWLGPAPAPPPVELDPDAEPVEVEGMPQAGIIRWTPTLLQQCTIAHSGTGPQCERTHGSERTHSRYFGAVELPQTLSRRATYRRRRDEVGSQVPSGYRCMNSISLMPSSIGRSVRPTMRKSSRCFAATCRMCFTASNHMLNHHFFRTITSPHTSRRTSNQDCGPRRENTARCVEQRP
jgi:hypothetical protein